MSFQSKLKKSWPILLIGALLFTLRSRLFGNQSNQGGQVPGQMDRLNFMPWVRGQVIPILQENGYSVDAAYYVAAVAALESARGTSRLAREANNLFGMMQPAQRRTLSLGAVDAKEGKFASFASWEDSVKDFVLWMNARQMPKQYTDTVAWVSAMKSRGYFGAPYTVYLSAIAALVREQGK